MLIVFHVAELYKFFMHLILIGKIGQKSLWTGYTSFHDTVIGVATVFI